MGTGFMEPRRRPAIAEAAFVIVFLFAVEFLASKVLPLPENPSEAFRFYATAMVRSLEILLLLLYWRFRFGNFSLLGLRGTLAVRGIKSGVRFSLMLGGFALFLEVVFRLTLSKSFLGLIAGNPPASPFALVLAGVILGPLFEELALRGFLYSAFRTRYGAMLSTLATALVFGALHYKAGAVPLVQVAGGIVFSIAYEKSGSLAAPLLVHSLGNLAIFSLSYLHLK
ncbi:CPBP family intramembrane metalloprotease [bacterium]|nr:MAG: CPBP family intramembrane metalloprotease [bacterium]